MQFAFHKLSQVNGWIAYSRYYKEQLIYGKRSRFSKWQVDIFYTIGYSEGSVK